MTLVIIDNTVSSDAAFVLQLKKLYEKVFIFGVPQIGLDYILQNYGQEKIIVILDILIPSMEGHLVLETIRKVSYNIPIILQSDKPEHKLSDFINFHIFAFLLRPTTDVAIIETIQRAELFLNTEVEGAIEEWVKIESRFPRNKPYLIEARGKSYSLNDILKEVRLQTPFGRQFQKDLIMATIDLLLKKKISL